MYRKGGCVIYPDGWKDEEGDVDDFLKPNAELRQVKDWVRAPATSAQPCGCDPGENDYKCERHRK